MINFFRALPPIALIPLVIVYFGVDEVAKLVILVLRLVLLRRDRDVMRASRRSRRSISAWRRRSAPASAEIFRKVIIPLTVPHILTALRVAFGVALGDAGRLRADRGPARTRRDDPECLDLLPARRHLCRHHLHRPDRTDHGHDPAQDHARGCWTWQDLGHAHRRKRAQFDNVSLSFETAKGRLNVVENVSYRHQ